MGSETVSGEIAKTVRINLVIRDSSIILRYSASKMAGCIAIATFFFGASHMFLLANLKKDTRISMLFFIR